MNPRFIFIYVTNLGYLNLILYFKILNEFVKVKHKVLICSWFNGTGQQNPQNIVQNLRIIVKLKACWGQFKYSY